MCVPFPGEVNGIAVPFKLVASLNVSVVLSLTYKSVLVESPPGNNPDVESSIVCPSKSVCPVDVREVPVGPTVIVAVCDVLYYRYMVAARGVIEVYGRSM